MFFLFFLYFKQQHQQCFCDGDDVSYVALPDDLQEYLYTCLFNLDITAFQKDQRGRGRGRGRGGKHYN